MEIEPKKLSAEKPRSLKGLALQGSVWTLSGYGTAQFLRLASNVILAKLLFPEAFGLMVLVAIFMQGITMFSDIGIIPSIIQNKRGDDPAFLNTAWTIQVIRGVIIWIVACIGAYPYSILYDEPLLLKMIPVAGLSAIIAGFNSTSLATANRNIKLGKITLLELITQSFSIFVMISWVYVHPTVWGLVVGGVASAVIKMALSHLWLGDIRNRFFWDKECAEKLFKFGRWILASTALTFMARQTDKLLLGYLLGTTTLGVYFIAETFKNMSSTAIKLLGNKVLFPSYSKVINDSEERLYFVLRKSRIIMILGSWAISFLLITGGSFIINYFYDERYIEAVWMIKILPLGALIGVLSITYQNVLLAKGKSAILSLLLTIQIIINTFAVIIGYYSFDLKGVIYGITFVSWMIYPFTAYVMLKEKLLQPEIDLPVIFLAILAVTFYLEHIYYV